MINFAIIDDEVTWSTLAQLAVDGFDQYVCATRRHVSNDEQQIAPTTGGDVEAAQVLKKSNVVIVVTSCQRDDYDCPLTTLQRVNSFHIGTIRIGLHKPTAIRQIRLKMRHLALVGRGDVDLLVQIEVAARVVNLP